MALEAAIHFHNMEADVILMGKNPPGGLMRRLYDFFPDLSMEMPFDDITSPLGRKITNIKPHSHIPTIKEYWENYLHPLIQNMPSGIIWKKTKVLRVQKRFLKPDENPPNQSRLMDLFRVFYTVNPREFTNKNALKTDTSLLQPFENMIDVDIVIDARGVVHNPYPTGGKGGLALNEANFTESSDVIHGFHEQKKLPSSIPQNIILAGSNTMAVLWILKLNSLIQDRHLLVITSESKPFSRIKEKNLSQMLQTILDENEKDWFKKKSSYEKKLDLFKKSDNSVKKDHPMEPVPGIKIIKDARITSMDRLSDREGLFVTVESGLKKEEIRTYKADLLIIEEGHERDQTFTKNLNPIEPGFYTLGTTDNLPDSIREINAIEDDLLHYFSKK